MLFNVLASCCFVVNQTHKEKQLVCIRDGLVDISISSDPRQYSRIKQSILLHIRSLVLGIVVLGRRVLALSGCSIHSLALGHLGHVCIHHLLDNIGLWTGSLFRITYIVIHTLDGSEDFHFAIQYIIMNEKYSFLAFSFFGWARRMRMKDHIHTVISLRFNLSQQLDCHTCSLQEFLLFISPSTTQSYVLLCEF